MFLFSILVVNPRVESGIVDDWSIARTAQLLAETGHIHYNGWEAPMLGWPLYLAAAATRWFGFSFTLVRATVMTEALFTIFLMQRILVRGGIRDWNAAFGALTLALCPVFFTTSVLFMTDVPGVLAVLICLYACLRALSSPVTLRASLWIVTAALANAVLGTTRQIAWLGLLVMVPSALWILRRRRTVAVAGASAWLAGVAFMLATLHWFNHQPYVLPEHLVYPGMTVGHVLRAALEVSPRIGLDLVLLTVPVALAFIPSVRPDTRTLSVLGIASALLVAYAWLWRNRIPGGALSPFLLLPSTLQTAETPFLSFNMPILGPSPSHLTVLFRLVLTIFCFAGVLVLLGAHVSPAPQRQLGPGALVPRDLHLLTLPFCFAYVALLLPRALFVFTLDRYLIFLLPFAILLLLYRFERTTANIGVFGLLPLALMAFYSTGLLHDTFAIYRANLAAIDELRAAGVPRIQINGGLEYNLWTQLLASDHVPAGGIRMPDGSVLPPPPSIPFGPCSQVNLQVTPAVHPLYAVAYPSNECSPVSKFAPVPFTTWLPPFHRTAVIIRHSIPTSH